MIRRKSDIVSEGRRHCCFGNLHRRSTESRYQHCPRRGLPLRDWHKRSVKASHGSNLSLPVSKEGHVVFTQQWEQFLFASSHNRIVMSLVHAGFGVTLLLTYLNELLHLRGSIIRKSKSLEFPLLQSVIHRPCCILKGCLAIRYVQKHGLHGGSPQGIERLPNAQVNLQRFVIPRSTIADFRVDGESRGSPSLAESCLRGTRSIRTIITASVDIPIAAAVECIQKGLDVLWAVKVGNPSVPDTVADLSLPSD